MPARSPSTCRSTTRRSTRCRAARRRSRRRSSWPAPTISRAARPSAGSSTRGGAATTATPSARWTCPDASRCAGRTRAGSAGSGTSRPPTRTGPGCPGADALGRADDLAAELDRAFEAAGPGTVAAFVAEPIVGATLAAVVPPDGYWPAIADVCRRHGVLLIADEVMTGFGRTGRWFGLDHWGVRPDILVAAKGASSGYWPFGFVAASDAVYAAVTGGTGFVHGFTYSHAPVGAAVAREVLRILEGESLVEASAAKGERLRVAARRPPSAITRRSARSADAACWSASSWSPIAPRASRSRAPRASPRRSSGPPASEGLLVYSGTGNANGVDGDTILLGPPFVVTDAGARAHRYDAGGLDRGCHHGIAAGRRPRLRPVTPGRSIADAARARCTDPAIVRSAGRWHRAGSGPDRARRGSPAGSAHRARHWRCSRRRSAPAGHRTRAASRTRRRSRHARRR